MQLTSSAITKTAGSILIKFLYMIDSTRIDLATEEDKHYEIDRWAKLFKAATWEELKMIAKNDPDLMQASDELYKVNKDDILRQQTRARADAEFWEKVHSARIEKMQLFLRRITKSNV